MMPFNKPPLPPSRFPGPRSKSSPPPNTTTVFIGVDSNKRPIKTAYDGAGLTSVRSQVARYPNYLPELKAKRVETGKQSFQEKLKERLETQRRAEKTALNQLASQKTHRISSRVLEIQPPPFVPQENRVPRPLILSPQAIKKSTPQVQSLFRVRPDAFSDSGSRVVQIDLARRQLLAPRQQRSVPVSSSDTDSDVSENLRRRTRRQHR